ncbi:terminase gpA endonuclease subunit [Lamprobacter sp.]|uniref:terminase gpA endonuclease subunit n=1 Tax=Lamprobacter sp. TaxID=3100796 RepID=UPI002B264663|nr:terminase gpA endonuclease subunit [Lamprobacter sp.]
MRLQAPSGAVDLWDPTITPYMIEPMDALESRQYQAMVFTGPAQSGKTQALIDCWIAHVATCTPSDMTLIQSTTDVARRFERDRWRKLYRHSPELKAAMSPRGHDNNTYDKTLRTGDTIEIGWPSENQLQGISRRRMAFTDYDRMPLSIGGQGSPFELGRKRTRKYRSLAMTLAESSVGHEQEDPHWRATSPHEAPPAKGILALYNMGTRHRLYWPCPDCGDYFMSPPGPDGFTYDVDQDLLGSPIPETLRNVRATCTACGSAIDESHKPAMLANARWVPDHCRITPEGRLEGPTPKTDIASYWLHGIHAAFSRWHDLILAYLQADKTRRATGDEEPLRTVIMQDFNAPYVAAARADSLKPAELAERAIHVPPRMVPDWVRYLIAVADVQAHYFSVMIIGHGPQRERIIIDRFEITESPRSIDGIDPAAYLEDWDTLTQRCVLARYPLAADPQRKMNIRLTLVDTGGGHATHDTSRTVTRQAYDWFRKLRTQRLDHRIALIKGRYQRPDTAGRTVDESRPDNTTRTDRRSHARGDVPLYLLHVNRLKDSLDNDLRRSQPGPGHIHLPSWLPQNLFDELTAEVRTTAGWEPAGNNRRNEAWDQLTYDSAADLLLQDNRGLVRSTEARARHARPADRIDWTNPPLWAGPHTANTEIDNPLTPTERTPNHLARPDTANTTTAYQFPALN